jgi:hypothetical protein
MRYSRTLGSAVALARGAWLVQPLYVAASNTHVYFIPSMTPDVLAVPLPNGSGNAVAPSVARLKVYTEVIADDANLYWAAGTNLFRCSTAGCGTAPAIHAVSEQEGTSLSQDALAVYWGTWNSTTGGGSILKVAK